MPPGPQGVEEVARLGFPVPTFSLMCMLVVLFFLQITFPVEMPPGPQGVEEVARLGFLCKLLETRILRTLRFKHGHVYSVSVSPFFGHSRPTRQGPFLGDVAVSFSSDPNGTRQLVDMALEEAPSAAGRGPRKLPERGRGLEIEQRAFESGQRENAFWLDRILRGTSRDCTQGTCTSRTAHRRTYASKSSQGSPLPPPKPPSVGSSQTPARPGTPP